MVTERQQDILNLIIDIFTKTHEPVGSKALQESINSSSATIRNDMAELEKQGLLEGSYFKRSDAKCCWFSVLCETLTGFSPAG